VGAVNTCKETALPVRIACLSAWLYPRQGVSIRLLNRVEVDVMPKEVSDIVSSRRDWCRRRYAGAVAPDGSPVLFLGS